MATVDKNLLRTIRPEIDAALAVIAKAHNLQSLALGRGTYDPRAGSFTFKLEGVAEGGMDKQAAAYTALKEMYELPPLGTVFSVRGRDFKITGINSTGSKLLVDCVQDGKPYLYKRESALALCGHATLT